MNETILRTEGLKTFYILDVFGTQKPKAVNDVARYPDQRSSRHAGERLWKDDDTESPRR